MASPKELKSSTQLLVEGINPKRVFGVFCESWGMSDIEIHDFGNNESLRPYLETLVRTDGFRRVRMLGIIRDAETSAKSAFESVQNTLRSVGFTYPPLRGYSIPGNPFVSVFVLPNGVDQGNLESLLWRSVEDTPEARCADEFLGCLDPGDIRVTRRDKARIQAYLASKPKPHGSVGVAAERGNWDAEHDAFAEIRRFLTNLQGASSTSEPAKDGPEEDSGVSGARR